jgi:predicted DNA-binding transcriptional regulator AlpA
MKASRTVPPEEKPVRGELLTISDAVKKTRLGKDWFYRHMDNGTLPFPWFLLTAGKRFMDSADIEDWLRAAKVPAGALPGDV